MIDRHPFQLRAEVLLGSSFISSRVKAFRSAILVASFWRHHEPEMMPVLLAAIRECLCVGLVRLGIE